MRLSLFAVIGMSMLCSLSLGQDSTPPHPNATTPPAQQTQAEAAQPTQSNRIAPGSVIPVQLTKTIDAKKVKTGDEVDAKVTQDMKTQGGEVLMPKDTKIVGHVTEAQARSKDQKESQLGITFDRALLKEGGDVSMPASIQAVIVPPSQNPDNANAGGGGMPSQAPGGGSSSAAPGGRSGMAGAPQQQPSSSPTGAEQPNTSTGNNARPQITASTQGVIGISNYKLSTPGDVTQGSVVSSEKGNVKLESGTLLLLRVHQ
jgi:hypothetical protein